jgi:hypothetical protein
MKAPGINNWDIALMKNTAVAENQRIELRAEFFNAFNHAQFKKPEIRVDLPTFGILTQAKDGRQIQFGLKWYF